MTEQTVTKQQCPRCIGRGYLPEPRRASRRNPNALGFYARNCPRCRGLGEIDAAKRAQKEVRP